MKKKISLPIMFMIAVFLFAGITAEAGNIAINKTKATVNIGETVELSLDGTDRMPYWTSYNANIARVDSFGRVTAVRKGKTTIRGRVGAESKTSVITVVDSSIKLNKTAATIYCGGTSTNYVQLKATAKGAYKNVTWESLNPDVAVVDTKGKVTSVAPGTAVIRATANDKSADCTITVLESSISLNMETIQLSTKGNGSSIKVTPAIVGSKKSVKWTTSDKTIATVSGGKVTGKKSGQAVITAEANGVKASCIANVKEGLISINEEKITLYAGGTKADSKTLKCNAGKKDIVTWSSSNTGVAEVSEKGVVTPVGPGTAYISVKTAGPDGTDIDTCEVTVLGTATEIAEENVTLRTKGTNKTYVLNKKVTGKTSGIKWTSSDAKVVGVSNGKLTAKKAGTAVITATANGVSDTVTVNVLDYEPTIKLNNNHYILYTVKGNTATLKATVDGPVRTAVWESSDPSVASVTAKGKVTALSSGTAVITASANGISDSCEIEVIESTVNLDRTSITLDKGQKETLGYDVIGASQAVKFAASNPKIASVNGKGLITAKTYGETDIKVTANNVTTICHVNVTTCSHTYDNGKVEVEPTCGKEGSKTFTCTQCGNTYVEIIPATGIHKFENVVIKEAGCDYDGYMAYACVSCGYVEGISNIPPAGHNWSEWTIIIAADAYSEGMEIRKCLGCGIEESRIIPIIPDDHEHEYKEVVVPPTCLDQGFTLYECVCGDSYKENYVDAAGHKWGEWVVKTPAQIGQDGLETRKCEVCGLTEKSVLEALPDDHEHKYDAEKVAPDCENGGYTEYKCSCGVSYKDDYVDALGHDYSEWEIIREATEKEEGVEECICSRCKDIQTRVIHRLEHVHSYEAVKTEATCTMQGFTTYTCSTCGYTYTADREPALGHERGEWEVIREVTCTSSGQEAVKCKRCDYVFERKFYESPGHKTDWVVIEEPGCLTSGKEQIQCSVCGKWFETTQRIPKTGHSWSEWEYTKMPAEGQHTTEDDFGKRHRTCSNCGIVREEDIVNILTEDGSIRQMEGSFNCDGAEETINYVNNLRAEQGLEPLQWSSDLEAIAKIRAAELWHSYGHDRPGGGLRGIIKNNVMIECGENIGIFHDNWDDVLNAWTNSSGHYANMVYKTYGYYCCASYTVYDSNDFANHSWVQLFALKGPMLQAEENGKKTETPTVTEPEEPGKKRPVIIWEDDPEETVEEPGEESEEEIPVEEEEEPAEETKEPVEEIENPEDNKEPEEAEENTKIIEDQEGG